MIHGHMNVKKVSTDFFLKRNLLGLKVQNIYINFYLKLFQIPVYTKHPTYIKQ
jgi:hypothetical protein